MRLFAVCLFVIAVAAPAAAQDTYTLEVVGPAEVAVSTGFSITTELSNTQTLQGWSFGVCHDPAAVDIVDATTDGTLTATVNGGMPAGFLNLSVYPGEGYTLGVVIDLFGVNSLAPGSGYVVSAADYTAGATETATTLAPCSTLGTPPVSTVVVVGGASIPPDPIALGLGVIVPITNPFIRGDANADALLNIADGIWMLAELFQGGPGTACDEANDANADGAYDAADAIYVFNYQFLGGSPPSAPFPDCGLIGDQTPEDCLSFPACP